MKYRLAQGRRAQLRLPLSPLKAEMALKALEDWRAPADEAAEKHWYKIGNQDGGPTQVNIFDEISWWGISAQEFVDELAGVKGDIEVHINSPGGDAFDGITIYNALASRPGVTTVVDGLAASAASVIAMAGQTRVMSPGAMLMIHDALAMTIGNEADHLESAKLLGKVSDNIAAVYAAHTSTPAAEWRKAMQAEGWYTAQEAVDAGLAHKLAARPGAGSEPGTAPEAAFDRSVFVNWHRPKADSADGDGPGVDESTWDGPAAMAAAAKADDPAAALNAICAGKREGDPKTEAAHALPHHKHPGAHPNRAGVTAALGRLDSTQGLTNKAAAEAHLKAHQAAISTDSDGDDGGTTNQAGGLPAWIAALPDATKEAAGR